LLIAFLGQNFSSYFIALDFQLNQKYIAGNLCENRNKPEMKCEGRCYLCRKLKKDQKDSEESPERRTDNRSELISEQTVFEAPPVFSQTISIQYTHFDEAIVDEFAATFFHPPTSRQS
jgi:hypothetical protein